MDSPCVKQCLYDPARGLCSSCGRTLEEITDWALLSDAERQRVMAQLPDRLFRLKSG